MEDPTQWPQLLPLKHEFLSAIPRKCDDGHPHAPIWWTPVSVVDFERSEGSAFTSLGLIRPIRLQPLVSVVQEMLSDIPKYTAAHGSSPTLKIFELSMCRALDRLQHFPCTFRDATLQVRTVQRFWLYCQSFMNYSSAIALSRHSPPAWHVHGQYMGAFTSDPGTVQRLFGAGIPVWFIRPDISILEHTTVRAVVRLDVPRRICVVPWISQARPLYTGLPGAAHLELIQHHATMATYLEISRAPLLTQHHSMTQVHPAISGTTSLAPTSSAPRAGPIRSYPSARHASKPCMYSRFAP